MAAVSAEAGYSDERLLQREREQIFASAWQYAGPAELVSEPGSFLASVAGHIPVVVTRARDGELRGLVNVCRHRGHVVADGTGSRATLQCPYHAWTYELDGTLRRAPRSEREPAFDTDGLSLLPIAIDTWGPFVFVNPDREAPPLQEALGGLPETIDLDGLSLQSHLTREHSVNWKVALERHPQHHFIWPNTTINVSAGQENLSIARWVPLEPEATVEATDSFVR
jgi:phenylpropionate dioxygenase-like ring-hydroxylating dioxygenase large terminal subunit